VLTNVPLTEDVAVQTLLSSSEFLLAMASCLMQESPTTLQCSRPLFLLVLLHHRSSLPLFLLVLLRHCSSHHDSSRRRLKPQGKAHKHKKTIIEASAASVYLFIAPLCFVLKI
jgi:hypothetical protein